jgi:hypothetical protein
VIPTADGTGFVGVITDFPFGINPRAFAMTREARPGTVTLNSPLAFAEDLAKRDRDING